MSSALDERLAGRCLVVAAALLMELEFGHAPLFSSALAGVRGVMSELGTRESGVGVSC